MMKVGIQTCTGKIVAIDLQFQIGFNEDGNRQVCCPSWSTPGKSLRLPLISLGRQTCRL